MEKENRIEKIPVAFSRSAFCPRCHQNNRPYFIEEDLKESQKDKNNQLKFIVIPSSDPLTFKIRVQSRIAKRGFTPHIYQYRGVTDGRFFFLRCCAVNGCGVNLDVSEGASAFYSIDETRAEMKDYVIEELYSLLGNKNREHFLCSKEQQFNYGVSSLIQKEFYEHRVLWKKKN